MPEKNFAFTDMFVFKIDTFANEIMGLSCYGRKSTPLRKVGKSAFILFRQLYELIEASSFQAGQAHSGFRCNLSALPRCVHLLPILWRADSRPPKLLPFGLGCRNAFRLALLDSQPFLLSNGSHHLNQDIVHHLKNPRLTFRQIHHGCRKVNHFQAYFSVQSRIVIVLVQIMINRFGPD